MFVSYNIFGQGNNTPEFVKRTYPFINDFGNNAEVMKDIASYNYYGMYNPYANKEDSIARLGILNLRLRDFKVYPFVSQRPIFLAFLNLKNKNTVGKYYQNFLSYVKDVWSFSIGEKIKKEKITGKTRDSVFNILYKSIDVGQIFPPEDSFFIKKQLEYWRNHRRWDANALKQYNIDIFTMDFTEVDKENKKKFVIEQHKRNGDGSWDKASERFCNMLIAKDTTELGYEKMIHYSYSVIPYLSRPSLTKRASITPPIFLKTMNIVSSLLTITMIMRKDPTKQAIL